MEFLPWARRAWSLRALAFLGCLSHANRCLPLELGLLRVGRLEVHSSRIVFRGRGLFRPVGFPRGRMRRNAFRVSGA